MPSTLERTLAPHLEKRDAVALVDGRTGEVMTYGELAQAMAGIGRFLRAQGVVAGDVVSLYSENSIDYAVAVFGIILSGAIANPLNITWSDAEIVQVLAHAEPKLIFHDRPLSLPGYEAKLYPIGLHRAYDAPAVAPLPAFAGAAGAILLYTSGTTGVPKGVLLSRDNLLHNIETARHHLPLRRRHTTMAILPLYHVHGFVSDLALMLFGGGTTVILPVFSLDGLEEIEAAVAKYSINSFSAVPFILELMARFQVRLRAPSLEFCVSGAAPLKPELIETYREAYGIQVIPAYGMTECMNYCTISPVARIVADSIGKPVGIEIRVVDERGVDLPAGQIGELVIRGPSVMKGGYYKASADCYLDAGNSWFRTGDLGFFDEDGYFFIKGRKKNMVIRGGAKIYPDDLTLCLTRHPQLKDAACIRVAHEDRELIACFAVAAETGAPREQDVLRYLERFVAREKLPDSVFFCASIPRTATNKVKIGELERLALERL